MKTVEMSKASRPLADYAAELGDKALVITRNRKPVAALVSLKGVDAEVLALSTHPAFLRIIRRARAEVRRGKVVSLDQVKQALQAQTTAANKALPRARRQSGRQ